MKLVSIRFSWLSLVLAVLLTGCTSSKIVSTYDGEALSAQKIAVLKTSENIQLIAVNGKPVKKYLMRNLEVKYGLLPGKNLVEFQYGSVWGVSTVTDEDAPRAKEVVSSPRAVLIDAKAGDQLTFRHDIANNIREAEALVVQFEAEVIDQNGQVVAVSGEPEIYQKTEEVSPSPVVEGPQGAQAYASHNAPADASLPAIEAMKVLWATASSEEKKAFLKWAFQ